MLHTNWRSPDGLSNTQQLQVGYQEVFKSIADLDALGHRLLARAATNSKVDTIDSLVGIALIRRVVTLFVGIRHLFENSAIEQSKIVVRAQFEALLAVRYLVHGARRDITPNLPSYHRSRESRARYYYAAALRQEIYRRQALIDRANRTKRVDKQVRAGLQAEIADRLEQLEGEFAAQHQQYGAFACYPVGKKKPEYYDRRKWFSFGFRKRPTNTIKQLAARMGWIQLYAYLYDPFSSLTHPSGISHDLNIENEHAEIYSPYLAEAFEFLAFWTCTWQALSLNYLSKAYHAPSFPDAQRVHLSVRATTDSLSSKPPLGWF